jgi:phage terminase large subunit-like protein
MGSVPQNATSQMEKNKDLQKMVQSTHFAYARQLKMAWEIKN